MDDEQGYPHGLETSGNFQIYLHMDVMSSNTHCCLQPEYGWIWLVKGRLTSLFFAAKILGLSCANDTRKSTLPGNQRDQWDYHENTHAQNAIESVCPFKYPATNGHFPRFTLLEAPASGKNITSTDACKIYLHSIPVHYLRSLQYMHLHTLSGHLQNVVLCL